MLKQPAREPLVPIPSQDQKGPASASEIAAFAVAIMTLGARTSALGTGSLTGTDFATTSPPGNQGAALCPHLNQLPDSRILQH